MSHRNWLAGLGCLASVFGLFQPTLAEVAGKTEVGTTLYRNGGLTRLGSTAAEDVSRLISGVIDPATDKAYFGTYTFPAKIIRVDLESLQVEQVLTLEEPNSYLRCAVIDSVAQKAYFGAYLSPGRIIKVDLNSFTVEDVLELPADENKLECAVIDPAQEAAYFGAGDSSGKVVKIDLKSFTRDSAITIGEAEAGCATIDPVAGYAYFGNTASPASIVRVNLASFTSDATLALAEGENSLGTATIDLAGGAAYFGTNTPTLPGRIIKVNLSNFTRSGALVLDASHNRLQTAAIDGARDRAYFGVSDSIISVDLEDFSKIGTLTFAEPGEKYPRCALLNPSTGFLYIGNDTDTGPVTQVSTSNRGSLHATRMTLDEAALVNEVRFHSHQADGSLVLSIYDDAEPKSLRWTSNTLTNTMSNAEVVIPIAAGTPSTVDLPAGTYHLAWETDSLASIGSFAWGTTGDGFLAPMDFAPSPVTLADEDIALNLERWTQYITYDADLLTPAILGDATPTTGLDHNTDGLIDSADLVFQ